MNLLHIDWQFICIAIASLYIGFINKIMKIKTILFILFLILTAVIFLIAKTAGNQDPINQQSIVQPVPGDSVNKFWYKRA